MSPFSIIATWSKLGRAGETHAEAATARVSSALQLLLGALLCAAAPAFALTAQAITGFAPATPLTYSAGLQFALSAAGGASGNPVLFASTTPGICTVAGNTASVKSAGTCKLTASQAGNASYGAAPKVSASVVISKINQTISFAAVPDQSFGTAPIALTAAASSGLAVKFSSTTATVCTVSGATLKLVSAGTCSLAASQAGNAVIAAAVPVTQTITVTPGSQTISFTAPASKTYGSAPFKLAAKASSKLAVTFTSTTPAVCSVAGVTVTLSAAGACGVKADQAGDANYQPAPPVIQTIAVGQANQSISFAAIPGKTYGAAPFTVSAVASSGLPVSFGTATPTVCSVTDATVTILSGGKCTIAANQAGNTNTKAATQVTRSFTIARASQTLSFAAIPDQSLGAASVTLSATASSGLPVTYKSGTVKVCTVAGATVTLLKAGSCALTASQGGNTNVSAAPPVSQSFTVAAGGLIAQAISGFAPATPTAYGPGKTFTLNATGGASGNPVVFGSATPAVCSVAGSTATVLAAGACGLSANQAGNAAYSAAPQVSATVQITPGSQTISFGALANQRIGAAPFAISAAATSGLPVAFNATTPAVCTLDNAVVTVIALGTCSLTANQGGNANHQAAPSVAQSFQVGQAAVAMAVGTAHACALTHAGGVQCWGANANGQLGDGGTVHRSTPADVTGLTSGVVAIEAGLAHTCAITNTGAALCWGGNDAGQLGDGTLNPSSTPRPVSGLAGNVIALALGSSHTCVLQGSGAVQCWGQNADGQLGDGSGVQRLTPVAVQDLSSGVIDLRAGDRHTCAVKATGATVCWGNNSDGQLGDGSTISRLAPVAVSGLGSGTAWVEGGSRHSCALSATGGVHCWGNNGSGQLGNGSTTASLTPAAVPGLSGIASLAAGDAASCAVSSAGGAQCWGAGVTTPQDIPGVTGGVLEIGLGNGYACALTGSSALQCWGNNGNGQLGDGSTTARTTPAYVAGLTGGKAANQSIAFAALAGKMIGDAPFAVAATASSGLAITFSSITTGVCTVSGSTVTLVATGICTIAANQAGNGSVNAAQQVTQSFTVAPATQAITGFLPGTPVPYSAGLTFLLSATGGASGNPVVFGSATNSICTVSGNTATIQSAGACTLTANQAGNATYSAAAQITANVVINAGSQSINFSILPGRKMGDAVFAISATASSGLPVAFSSNTAAVCTVAGNSVTLVAAGTCTIAADQSGNGTYGAAPQMTQSFMVSQGAQAISDFAPPTPIAYGAGQTFALTATGGVSSSPVVFASSTPGVCTVANSIATVQSAGVCMLTANQTGDGNYGAAPQVTATVKIEPMSQSIAFNDLAGKTMGDAPVALTATASSGLPVAFSTLTPAVCTVANGTVTLAATGACTIAADQAGNANIGAAPQVTQSFAIDPAGQTIVFNPLAGKKMGEGPVALNATASSGLPVSFTSATPSICTVDAGTVTLAAPGACTIAADQAGDSHYGAAPRVTQSFAVTAGGAQMYFIDADHLNTPRMITDQSNTPVWVWGNDEPFGANAPNDNPSGLGVFEFNLRFAGQYADKETGLHYNYFRDYDPSTGRFVQSDLIGLAGGINTYNYAAGNPISKTDPSGLLPLELTPAYNSNQCTPGNSEPWPPLFDPSQPQPGLDNLGWETLFAAGALRALAISALEQLSGNALSELTKQELKNMIGPQQAKALGDLFGTGMKGAEEALQKNLVRPSGLTNEAVAAYKELANRIIASYEQGGNTAGIALQKARLEILKRCGCK